jgi:gamma-glutamyltranspeptidase/glutathione hydrolase
VLLIQMLNVLAGFDLASAGYGSAAAWHPMVEAMKFAYADRSLYLGDSDFVSVPVARLISPAYADSLRRLIQPQRALDAGALRAVSPPPREGDDTTHLSVVDAAGNAIAATLTINLGFGSGLLAKGTGVLLNDEMDDFAAAPGQPNAYGLLGAEANAIAPGKRPLSSMAPTILTRKGQVFLVTGSPGGSRIITTTLQTIVHVVDFGMDVRQAVTVPRIHHQWFPTPVYFEAYGVSPDTRSRLETMGHTLQLRDAIGNAQAIVVDRESGRRHGGSDPRGEGLALGF